MTKKLLAAIVVVVLLVVVGVLGLNAYQGKVGISGATGIPAQLFPGDHLPVSVVVTNGTPDAEPEGVLAATITTAARQRLSASVGANADPVDRRGSRRMTVPIIVPLVAAAGPATITICYNIEVCSTSPAVIGRPPAGFSGDPYRVSPDQLLRDAVRAGSISADVGLLYTAYALTGNPLLPLRYQGTGPVDAYAFLDRLALAPPDIQASIKPLLTPPYSRPPGQDAPSTGFNVRRIGGITGTSPIGCNPDTSLWASYPSIPSHVLIWYPRNAANALLPWAEDLSAWADGVVWNTFAARLGQTPLSDASAPCNGGDGRLDVVLTSDPSAPAETLPADPGGPYSHAPMYVVVDDTTMLAQPPVSGSTAEQFERGALAHELFHAFEFSFTINNWPGYGWWLEGAANWGLHLLTPGVLQLPPCDYVSTLPLDTFQLTAPGGGEPHQYTTWWFDYWWERQVHFPEDFVRKVLQAAATAPTALAAIDQVAKQPNATGNFFSEFGQQLWNGAFPYNQAFQWLASSCTAPPGTFAETPAADGVSPGPNIPLRHLTSLSFQYPLNQGETAFRVSNLPPHSNVAWSLIGDNGRLNWWTPYLTRNEIHCTAAAANRELTFMVSNISEQDDTGVNPGTLAIALTNVGCGPWVGTVDGSATGEMTDGSGRQSTQTWHATVVLVPHLSTADRYVHFGNNAAAPGWGTSSASIVWSETSFTPVPPIGCPYTLTVGPFTARMQDADGLMAALFPDDAPPVTYRHYAASTLPAGGGYVNNDCVENSPGSLSLVAPWWETGPPANQQVSPDGQTITGSYARALDVPGWSGTASWRWSLSSVTPTYTPASQPHAQNRLPEPLPIQTPPAATACPTTPNPAAAHCGTFVMMKAR